MIDLNCKDSKKVCYSCKQEKSIFDFNKHKMMKDGYLNLCKSCALERSKKRRQEKPLLRKEEWAKFREKNGRMTRKEYFAKRKENAKGRKFSSNQYANKRRMKVESPFQSEFDIFVFSEAIKLREQRKELTGFSWHVDHIVPLNHKSCSGLHNAYNLQVVPASWNLKKKHTSMETYWNIAGF